MDSVIVLDGSAYGYAMGNISYDVPSTGVDGSLMLETRVMDGSDKFVLQNHGILSWSTPTSWTDAGRISMKSAFDLYASSVNWNVTGLFDYGTNEYSLLVTGNEFSTINNWLLASASGGYGGDWSWW